MQTDNYVNVKTDVVDGYIPLNMQKMLSSVARESKSVLAWYSFTILTNRSTPFWVKSFLVSEINIYPALLEETTHNCMS